MLGTSRGAQDPDAMVDRLVELGIDLLFVIGGDGSMRGAARIADALLRRGETIGVIGIPKTIDNDIPFIGQSFGFVTSFTEAAKSINAAMVEAQSAIGGVGLVKLMGRHAGFIASYAALANHVADFVLIPEVPFRLDGPGGFLACSASSGSRTGAARSWWWPRAPARRSWQAGTRPTPPATRASPTSAPICATRSSGTSRRRGAAHLKYIDPGYMIRSVPAARTTPSTACGSPRPPPTPGWPVGPRWSWAAATTASSTCRSRCVTSERNQVAPDGDLWLSVLESTAQPVSMI